MIHEYTVETLYHFTCGKCKGWWSHAQMPTVNEKNEFQLDVMKKLMYCPHCGEDGDVQIKKEFKGV